MIQDQKVSLVIPCHNEAEGLRRLLPLVPHEVDEVVIVDNNSTDATATIAKKHGARVITERTPGYGAAYQAGFAAAQGEIIVTMDGDGQYPMAQVVRILEYFTEHNLDFLSTNRFPLKSASMSLVRQIGNYTLTATARLLFGVKIKDTQSGMWVLRRHALVYSNPIEQGMAFSEEIKLKAWRAGLRCDEIHIPYEPRIGHSKLSPLSDGLKNLHYLFKLWWKKN